MFFSLNHRVLSTTSSESSYWMVSYDLAFLVLHSCRRNAIEQLCMFKRIERRPMAWPCLLTIGSCLSIRIVGYKAVRFWCLSCFMCFLKIYNKVLPVKPKVFSATKYHLPCVPGDRRETEENVGYSWSSNQPERWREARDRLLSGWWQWDGGAEGGYHPRWGSCLKSDCLKLLYVLLNNTLKSLFCLQVFVMEAILFPSPK